MNRYFNKLVLDDELRTHLYQISLQVTHWKDGYRQIQAKLDDALACAGDYPACGRMCRE